MRINRQHARTLVDIRHRTRPLPITRPRAKAIGDWVHVDVVDHGPDGPGVEQIAVVNAASLPEPMHHSPVRAGIRHHGKPVRCMGLRPELGTHRNRFLDRFEKRADAWRIMPRQHDQVHVRRHKAVRPGTALVLVQVRRDCLCQPITRSLRTEKWSGLIAREVQRPRLAGDFATLQLLVLSRINHIDQTIRVGCSLTEQAAPGPRRHACPRAGMPPSLPSTPGPAPDGLARLSAGDRNRTCKALRPREPKSRASASSATPASHLILRQTPSDPHPAPPRSVPATPAPDSRSTRADRADHLRLTGRTLFGCRAPQGQRRGSHIGRPCPILGDSSCDPATPPASRSRPSSSA